MKPETLKRIVKEMEWHHIEAKFTMPMAQGCLINALLKEYFLGKTKPRPLRVGWTLDSVAIETKRQIAVWKDTGIGARFLGLINRDTKEAETVQTMSKKNNMVFETRGELWAEIKKRDYNNILGLKAKVTEEQYYEALEALPPFKMGPDYFVMSEALSDNLYSKYYKEGKQYFEEVIELEDEEVMRLEMAR